MTTTVLTVLLVVLLLVVVGGVLLAVQRRRSAALQRDFGPEYERLVEQSDGRRDAERELTARKEEHEQLTLRPLTAAARERYLTSWTGTQARFVDAPAQALGEADALVTSLLSERGYPTDGFDRQARLLSVEHADVLQCYRRAHDVELASRARTADTEAVRQAMLDFRRVFESVMGEDERDSRTAERERDSRAAERDSAYTTTDRQA